mmetsp:Transcript_68718/g.109030  ORF Transcript_68718/g.109030 Transcript_68718/m.109030 type:complete len:187 (-) Transcript_68718:96-656(-)
MGEDASTSVHPDFPLGSVVRLSGLSAAAELNGAEATCGKWNAARGRMAVQLASGEEKNVKPDNLILVSAGCKRSNQSLSPTLSPTLSPSVSPSILPSPSKKLKRGLPKLNFDDKIELDEDSQFMKNVFLAVKAYTDANPTDWTASLMRNDISEENGWENDNRFADLVKASLLKLGFRSNGAQRSVV